MQECKTVFEEFFMQMTAALIAVDSELRFEAANNLATALFPTLAETPKGTIIDECQFPQLYPLLKGTTKSYKSRGKIYDVGICHLEKNNVNVLWFRDVTKEKEAMAMLKLDHLEMTEIVNEKNEFIRDVQQKVIVSLAEVIESRDESTGGHVKRTNDIVKVLLEAMLKDNYPGVDASFLEIVSGCSSMHDIGKISVPDAVLQKNGKLTDEEFEAIKKHSSVGGKLINKILDGIENENVLNIAKNIAQCHHEKWNGFGYPNKLKGTEIPLEARVMAIADVYDALVSKRCYKPPMPFEKAKAFMEESFGSHFDPTLQKYFEECLPQIESYYQQTYDQE